jgi:hypothetical protein
MPNKSSKAGQHYLRPVLLAMSALMISFALLGVGLNDLDHKYVRALPYVLSDPHSRQFDWNRKESSVPSNSTLVSNSGNPKAASATANVAAEECHRAVLVTAIPNSRLCCEGIGMHGMDWVCSAAFDPINRVLASLKCYFIPLIPLALTFVMDVILGGGRFEQRHFIAAFLRVVLYAAIFLFRLVRALAPLTIQYARYEVVTVLFLCVGCSVLGSERS